LCGSLRYGHYGAYAAEPRELLVEGRQILGRDASAAHGQRDLVVQAATRACRIGKRDFLAEQPDVGSFRVPVDGFICWRGFAVEKARTGAGRQRDVPPPLEEQIITTMMSVIHDFSA
jgi:hypothetical protein